MGALLYEIQPYVQVPKQDEIFIYETLPLDFICNIVLTSLCYFKPYSVIQHCNVIPYLNRFHCIIFTADVLCANLGSSSELPINKKINKLKYNWLQRMFNYAKSVISINKLKQHKSKGNAIAQKPADSLTATHMCEESSQLYLHFTHTKLVRHIQSYLSSNKLPSTT